MAIIIDDESRVFSLHTKNATYQMKADAQNVLLHTYYGEKRITVTNLFCFIRRTEDFQAIRMKWGRLTGHILWTRFCRNIAASVQAVTG